MTNVKIRSSARRQRKPSAEQLHAQGWLTVDEIVTALDDRGVYLGKNPKRAVRYLLYGELLPEKRIPKSVRTAWGRVRNVAFFDARVIDAIMKARPQFAKYEWAANMALGKALRARMLDLYVKSLPEHKRMELLQDAAAAHLEIGKKTPPEEFTRYAAWLDFGEDDQERAIRFREWVDTVLLKETPRLRDLPPSWRGLVQTTVSLVMEARNALKAGNVEDTYIALRYLAFKLDPVGKEMEQAWQIREKSPVPDDDKA